MTKYKLSKYVSINDPGDEYDNIPAKYANGYFIMYNETRDSEYLINETVKYYIDKFSIPKTEEEILKEIEEDVQSDGKEIRETCSRFFEFLCKTKILIPGDQAEEVIAAEPLYNEGDIIDNLRISTLLSARQYTDVYAAVDTTNNHVYVIKLLNGKKAITIKRFHKELAGMQAEYKMLQKASHIPSTNMAFNFIQNEDRYAYLVLEYINGKSLSAYLKENAASLTNSSCMQIIEAILTAFSNLHESDIIHGDVHSSNILVTKERDVKIIDLGMSRNVSAAENEVIKSGGVYYYMPPERINITTFKKFSNAADLSSDVYQVGLLIYFVLYNTLPFEGFIWEELAQSIKEDDPVCPNVSFLNYPVPIQLVHIIKKCLHKQPAERYGNASEILAAFKKQAFGKKQLAEI